MSNVLCTTVRVGLVMICVDYGVHEIASQILGRRRGDELGLSRNGGL